MVVVGVEAFVVATNNGCGGYLHVCLVVVLVFGARDQCLPCLFYLYVLQHLASSSFSLFFVVIYSISFIFLIFMNRVAF